MLFACKGNKPEAPAQAPAPEQQAAPAAKAPGAGSAQPELNAKVVPFSEIFKANADGSVSPKVKIEVNGTPVAAGAVCTKGTQYGGLDLSALNGKKLFIAHKGDVIVVKGAME